MQVLSFSGHSIKPRVVPDSNQIVHTCGCYTCIQSLIDSICQRKLVPDFGQRKLIIPISISCLPWNSRLLLPILYFVHHISSYCGCFHVKHSYLYFLGIILQTLLIMIMHLSENKSIFTVCKWQILTTIVLAGRVILYLLCYLMVDVQYICVLRFLLPAMRILPAGSKITLISMRFCFRLESSYGMI